MNYTTNYQLKKPSDDDHFDIKHQNDNMDKIDANLSEIAKMIYPVGSVYMSVNAVNPAVLFGGTWAAWGQGRVPMGCGQGAGLTNRPSPEAVGGAELHTLTAEQLAVHGHGNTGNPTALPNVGAMTGGTSGTFQLLRHQNASTNAPADVRAVSGRVTRAVVSGALGGRTQSPPISHTQGEENFTVNFAHDHTLPNHVHGTGNAGSGAAHNNIQPFITCYMWKRIA